MAIKKRFTQLNSSGSNHKIIDAESAYVTGSFQVGPGLLPGTDTNFFVSGNIGGHTAGQPGVGVFGGDLVVSGNLVFEGTISGNIPGAYFYSTTNSVVESSGSLYVSGAMRAVSLSASNGAEISGSTVFAGAGGVAVGSDTVFFVSGAAGNNSGNKAVFGGTVFVSGNIEVPFGTALLSRNTAGNGWIGLTQYADGTQLDPAYGNQALLVGDGDGKTTGIIMLSDNIPVALITGSNQGYFSGSYKFHDGLSGSLQALPNGLPYLISGPNITITTNSLGQIEVTGSAGATSPQYWFSTGSNEIYTTGSILIKSGLATSPGPNLIKFDVSGSAYQSANVNPYGPEAGAYITVEDVIEAAADYNGVSGSITIAAATVIASGSGGGVNIIAGNGGYVSGSLATNFGGTISIAAGNGGISDDIGLPFGGPGGQISVAAGAGGNGYSAGGLGGNLDLYAGSGGTFTATNVSDTASGGSGGDFSIYAGNGGDSQFGGTPGVGGDVNIAPGSGGKTDSNEDGIAGNIILKGAYIPTVSASQIASTLTLGTGDEGFGNYYGFRVVSINDSAADILASSTDTFFFISGSKGAKDTADRGVAVFGGDLHVSGGLTVDNSTKFFGGLSGSLTKLTNGSDYLVAGPNITIATNSLGQIEITGSATTVPEYFYSLINDVIESSGSLYVSGTIWSSFLSSSNGIEVTGSAFFNDNVTLGASVSDIIIVNGQLTASAGLEITGSSTFAAGSTFTFNGNGVFAGGLTGSLQEVSAGVPYLLAGDYITIATNSLGQIEVSASNLPGTEVYWTSDVANNIYTTGSAVISSSLSVNPAGTGRGLLRVGGLDIGPITGSGYIYPDGILPGNILSASNGVFDGTWGAVVRHEFHILGIGVDGGGTINQFAATYLVMSAIGYDGIQRVRSVTELSRETSGSYAENWDVNVAEDCSIEITSSVGGTGARWYAQRVKEMAININGDITA